MKRVLLAAVAAAALFSTQAQAQTSGFYGRLDVGVGVAGDVETDASVTGTGDPLPFSSNQDLDVGWQAGAAIGYDGLFIPNLRGEIEGLYLSQETDDDSDNFDDVFDTGDEDDDSSSADIDIYGGFANLIYDFPGFQGPFGGDGLWRPFLGAGVGYGKLKVDYQGAEADDEVLMYQAKAGLSYDFTEATALELGYRYLRADSGDITDDLDDLVQITGEVDTEIHSVVAGIRHKFGGGYY
jgi:opacity protein-like surface antigen